MIALFLVLLSVDGYWSEWKTITNGSCSVTCGDGVIETILERVCIQPKFGGKDCQGETKITRSKPCELDSCPGIKQNALLITHHYMSKNVQTVVLFSSFVSLFSHSATQHSVCLNIYSTIPSQNSKTPHTSTKCFRWTTKIVPNFLH